MCTMVLQESNGKVQKNYDVLSGKNSTPEIFKNYKKLKKYEDFNPIIEFKIKTGVKS